MQIEDVKGWQWAIIGLLVGLAFSAVLKANGSPVDNQALDTITQGQFEGWLRGEAVRNEQWLVDKYHADKAGKVLPMIRDVVVHPPQAGDATHIWWVSGKACDVKIANKDPKDPKSPRVVVEEWTPFKYPAPEPYVPGYATPIAKEREKAVAEAKAKNESRQQIAFLQRRADPFEAEQKKFGDHDSFPNVDEYVKAAMAVYGTNVKAGVAWWDRPAALWTLPPVGGLLVIGIAWPLGLTILQTAGLARPPKPVRSTAVPAPAPVAKPDRSAGVVEVVQPAAARPLEPGESKEYGGEFYPVVKQTHK